MFLEYEKIKQYLNFDLNLSRFFLCDNFLISYNQREYLDAITAYSIISNSSIRISSYFRDFEIT